MNTYKDRIDELCNQVADIKHDLQVVLDELYSLQSEQEEERPADYSANFIRTMSLWLDRRPEVANDGKTIEQLINEFKIASE